MTDSEYKNIIEALLFAWGEPLDLKEIAKIIELNKKQTLELLESMTEEMDNKGGLRILKTNTSYQLTTKEDYFPWLKKLSLSNEKTRLSNAAIETLSIVAYKQPITRAEIEAIRGVKSDKVLDSLLNKRLIDEIGRLDQPGKPIIYGTTEDFLKFFSIEDLDQLPKLENQDMED